MSITPRSEIRQWIREQLDDGMPQDDVQFAAVEYFLDRADIVAELVSAAVRAEVNGFLATAPAYRKNGFHKQRRDDVRQHVEAEVEALPNDAPLAKLSPTFDTRRSADVMVNLARMTKPEVLNLASEFEGAAQKNEELAAFLRSVAAGLQAGKTVGETFTKEHLQNLRNRMTTHTTTRVYLGQRQIAVSERTN